MRATSFLACVILAASPRLQAQGLADTLPLRPGAPNLRIVPWDRCPATPSTVADCTGPWIPYRSIVSIGGRAGPRSWREAARSLVGEIGTPIVLRYRTAGGIRTMNLTRADVFAPDSGFSGLVITTHFAVHHRPAEARRARSLAAAMERAYARSGLPSTTDGRRAHLWSLREYQERRPGQPYPGNWGAWVFGRYSLDPAYGELFTYVAYGSPGIGGHELYGGGWFDANTLHRNAVAHVLGNTPWLDRSQYNGDPGPSLREYIRERYGVGRLEQIWRADDSLDVAIPRTLGISRSRLEADWRRHIFSMGPDPAAGPATETFGVTIAWVAALLIAGAVAARNREVG
jgi:hypothetical protein